MISNMRQLERVLANVEGLEIEAHVFPDESHYSVFPMNCIRGVQWAYKRPEVDFLEAYKKAMEEQAKVDSK